MNICVFDTETTNAKENPFCYNVGFVIFDTEQQQILEKADFVIEQIWHNIPLFKTAYYADKRPIYVSRMRGKTVKLEKWGYVCQYMRRCFKRFNVEYAFAYNSPFDARVFDFNCDYFKTLNPFDNIPIIDIMGYVHQKIAFTKDFQDFCEKHNLLTEAGNFSTTAETVTRFLRYDTDFQEEHTALADSEIELEILNYCCKIGCEYGKEYKRYNSIPRKILRTLTIDDKRNENIFNFDFEKITISRDKTKITLK